MYQFMHIYTSIANMDLSDSNPVDQNQNPIDPNSNPVNPNVLDFCMLFFHQFVLFLISSFVCINIPHTHIYSYMFPYLLFLLTILLFIDC